MIKCPNCQNDDLSMIEYNDKGISVKLYGEPKVKTRLFCISCSKTWDWEPVNETSNISHPER